MDKIKRCYDDLAKEYSDTFLNEHARKPKDREMLLRFAEEVGSREPVWDLGCGPGQTTNFLNGVGVRACGLDLSERMVEQAVTNFPGTVFRPGDMLDLDFASDTLEGIVSFYAMVHFTPGQVSAALGEMYRVLRPGGVILLTYHVGDNTIHVDEFLGKRMDIDFTFFPTTFMEACLKSSGFERIEIIERDPYAGIEYQSRRAYAFARKPTPARGTGAAP